ncbi:MAG: MgtC/SapB family protein [Bacteroidetes bacterium]|jgi:putative Mg2+ transporter-C (MgtC) family protein|nr:MgtC/SapB family protein [Bacteroidota bacterium]
MLSYSEILIRLSVASLFGAFIGLERERKNWTAGLRTHMMVCVGSCLIMIVSAFGFADILGHDNVVLDPSRVAAQVVSGIGFIGAGTILFMKQGTVHGLTTAAGLWTVAAIGLATGGGMYFAAAITTVIALIILWALKPLENKFEEKFKEKVLRISTGTEININELMNLFLKESSIKIKSFSLDKGESGNTFLLMFDNYDQIEIEEILNNLKEIPSVKTVSWTK